MSLFKAAVLFGMTSKSVLIHYQRSTITNVLGYNRTILGVVSSARYA